MSEQLQVQMIRRGPYEAQDLIEYAGDPEGIEGWLDALVDYDVTAITDGVRGWDDYTHLVRLASIDRPEEPPLYYLVPAAVIERATIGG